MHGRTRSSSAHSDVSSGPGTSVQRRGNGGSTSNEAAPSRLPPRSQSMQEARLQSLTGASSGVFRTSSDPADPRPCQNRRRREETFVLSGLSTEPIAAGERLQTSSLLIHLQQGRNRRRRQERVDKWVSEHAGMPRRGQQRSFSDLGMPTLSSTPPELCHKPVPLMPSATSGMTSGLTATSLRCCASVHPDSETYSLAGTDTSKRRTSLLVCERECVCECMCVCVCVCVCACVRTAHSRAQRTAYRRCAQRSGASGSRTAVTAARGGWGPQATSRATQPHGQSLDARRGEAAAPRR
jgi:hypothetical protein